MNTFNYVGIVAIPNPSSNEIRTLATSLLTCQIVAVSITGQLVCVGLGCPSYPR